MNYLLEGQIAGDLQIVSGAFRSLSKGRGCRMNHYLTICVCGRLREQSILSIRKNSLCVSCTRSGHGMTRNGVLHPIYSIWVDMRRRCEQPSRKGYEYWGGRGIAVCARWQEFSNFLQDMGNRPSLRHSLDRIDVNGDYEPSNCRWATDSEQALNRRNARTYSYLGKEWHADELAAHAGMVSTTLVARLNKLGWPVEKAVTTPVANHGRSVA